MTEELQLYISRGLTDCFLLVLWVYVPEIFPTRVRNMAVGLINTTGKLGAVFGIVFVQVNIESSIVKSRYTELTLDLPWETLPE